MYLYRVKDSEVLLTAIRDGLGLLIWEQDAFAYADGWDEVGSRYRGLRAGVRFLRRPQIAIDTYNGIRYILRMIADLADKERL